MTVLIPEADPVPSSAKSILRRQARRESTSAPRTITATTPRPHRAATPGGRRRVGSPASATAARRPPTA